MNNIEKIQSFNGGEWDYDQSSGWSGRRNLITGEWLYEQDYKMRERLLDEYNDRIGFLRAFRDTVVYPSRISDLNIDEFMNKYFEEQVNKVYGK